MKARTELNLNFYEINGNLDISEEIETGSKAWYQAIKQAGYKFAYRWINSDDNWMWFAKTNAQACEGAAELFASEKGYWIKFARIYYSEQIDVYELDQIINEWF